MGPPPGHVKEEKKELDKAEVVLDKKEEKFYRPRAITLKFLNQV